jgi:hypothetical protein
MSVNQEQLAKIQDAYSKRFNFAAETQIKPVNDMVESFQAYIN